jgi:hypothetical protein
MGGFKINGIEKQFLILNFFIMILTCDDLIFGILALDKNTRYNYEFEITFYN